MSYHCSKCDGTNVESLQWVDMNTGEAQDNEDGVGEYFCRDCNSHTDVHHKKDEYDDDEDNDEGAEDTLVTAP